MKLLRSLVLGFALITSCWAPPLAAQSRNDHQIDWMVSASDWANAEHQFDSGVHTYRLSARPTRLYVAQSDIMGEAGARLLPAGSQFYGMTGPVLTMCSQAHGPEGTLGRSNRVCLIDEDGDGTLDSYWFRAFGRSQLRFDTWWFAMNAEVPTTRSRLQQADVHLADPSAAGVLLGVELTFSNRNRGRITAEVNVDDGDHFSGRCLPENPSPSSDGRAISACMMPDLQIHTRNLDARSWRDREMRVTLPTRNVRIYFVMSSGLFYGRDMEAILFR